ncbi:MAG: PAS domain S-box protein [Armatimonadota bacterium]|nr:PAS domain S-box protein [Armatimonadota bacterium]
MSTRAAGSQPEGGGRWRRRRRALGRQARTFFESVADAVSDALVVTDGRYRIVFVNRQACEAFGYSREEIVGQPLDVLVPAPQRARHAEYVQGVRPDAAGAWRRLPPRRLKGLRKDGTEFPAEIAVTARPLGRSSIYVAVVRDLTERSRADDLLRVAAAATSAQVGTDFLRTLVRTLAEAIGTRYAFVSRILEGSPDTLETLAFWNGADFEPPSAYKSAGTPCEEALRHGSAWYLTGAARSCQGDTWLHRWNVEGYLAFALRDGAGRAIGVLGVMDVRAIGSSAALAEVLQIFAARAAAEVERQRSEKARRRVEERYRVLFEQANDAILLLDPDQRTILDANPHAAAVLGRDRSALVGQRIEPLLGDAAGVAALLQDADGGPLTGHETCLRGQDGRRRDVVFNAASVQLGDARAVLAIGRDVTDLNRARQQLERLNRRLAQSVRERTADLTATRTLLDTVMSVAPVGIFRTAVDGTCEYANGRWLMLTGLDDDQAGIGDWLRAVHPDDLGPVSDRWAAAVKDGTVFRAEFRLRGRAGVRWVVCEATPLLGPDGRAVGHVGSLTDITDRVESEEQLRRISASLAEAQRIAQLGNWEWDVRQNTLWWSDQTYRLFGQTPRSFGATYEAFLAAVHPEDVAAVRSAVDAALHTGAPYSLEHRIVLPDGSVKFVHERAEVVRDEAGRPLRMIGTVQDITARKEAEDALRVSRERLQHAQKMEAVGQLAGGIAHDFNNLLTAILGCGQGLLDELDERHPCRIDAREIVQAAERAARLTRQLLAFSRQQVLQLEVLDLNTVVRDMVPMLQRLLGPSIVLDVALRSVDDPVLADRGQVEQLLLNLVVNGRDAMPDGGTIRVATAPVAFEAADEGAIIAAPAGRYVALVVSDTGTGMTDEVRRRAFEPFFTTKPRNQGTGLGLATVYGIVQQSKGGLRLESAPGRGTTFTIYIPSADSSCDGTGFPG